MYAKPTEPERRRHIGDSKFESWYAWHPKAVGGDKQLARDAYAAGMGDPPAQPERKPMTRDQAYANAAAYFSHNQLAQAVELVRDTEAFHGIKDTP